MSVAMFIELYLDRHHSPELGLYFTVFLFTLMCDVWVTVCQPFVKRIYDTTLVHSLSCTSVPFLNCVLHNFPLVS